MNNTIEDYKGIEDSASPLSCNASSWHPYVVIGFTLLNSVISLGKQFLNNNKHMNLTTMLKEQQKAADEKQSLPLKTVDEKRSLAIELDVPENLKASTHSNKP